MVAVTAVCPARSGLFPHLGMRTSFSHGSWPVPIRTQLQRARLSPREAGHLAVTLGELSSVPVTSGTAFTTCPCWGVSLAAVTRLWEGAGAEEWGGMGWCPGPVPG